MNQSPEVVLDASALLAYLQQEPGSDRVEARLHRAAISSVNLAEVLEKSVARGKGVEGRRQDLEQAGLTIVPFLAEDAEVSARISLETRPLGLSLGDRACLALALRLSLPALTADQRWKQVKVGVAIELVR